MEKLHIIGHFNKYYWNYPSEEIRLGSVNYEEFMEGKWLISSHYWKDLELLLIQYHISTPNNLWDFNYALELKTLGNYSSKEKAISVIIPVILEEFLNLSPYERKKKFADDALYAVKLVRDRLEKKKLDIDFDKLISDVEKCNEEYLR